MHPFTYIETNNAESAVEAVVNNSQAAFFAGGTTLIDLMKLNVLSPARLVDINQLPYSEIQVGPNEISVGANVRNSDLAHHPAIRENFPVLSEAILAGASVQLRNLATTAGNLMQRTRCGYFRDPSAKCNKRNPGEGCDAILGFNRNHAVLGTSGHCIATHPSDMCVALMILDAEIETISVGNKTRRIKIEDFYLLPGETPHRETALEHGELITRIHLPITKLGRTSHYLKVRDRASYEFALASAAVALEVEAGVVKNSRVALH